MAAGRGPGGLLSLLICRVGSRVCGVPLAHVVETMRPLPVEPLAHLPSFVDGVSLIRGRPTPVLDARRLLGQEGERGARSRLVTLELAERSAALVVDEVLGVRSVEVAELAELPALLRDAENEVVAALGTLDHELLVVLEHSRLLPEAVWTALASAAQAKPA
jgi:purine-binding chemotaxis protein CheW